MSKYQKQFPKSIAAAYVRVKESRFGPYLDKPITPSYQTALSSDVMDRTIWLYWGQGWDDAPEVVQRCAASWSELNKDWNVTLLHDGNLSEYISTDNVPDDINRTKQSNVWRLRLLEKFGGVWADATVLCMVPVSTWLPFMVAPTGSFAFKRPNEKRPYASWFMAAQQESYLIKRYRKEYEKYLRVYGDFHTFALHYVFEFLLKADKRFAREFHEMPSVSANPSLAFGRWLSNPKRFPEPTAAGVPVHKLTWKLPISMEELDFFLYGKRIS